MTEDPEMTLPDVVERIRAIAETGTLPAERQLADQLGVNRYVLRKALAKFRTIGKAPAGRVTYTGKRRSTSHDIAAMTSPAEVWEVRLSLEPEIARLAAVRGTEMEIRAIEQCHAEAEPLIFELERDIAFHHFIAVASHNALADNLMRQVMALTRDDAFRMKLPEFTTETGYRHHQAIVEAIRGRRAADAKDAMHTHLLAILQWLNGNTEPNRTSFK